MGHRAEPYLSALVSIRIRADYCRPEVIALHQDATNYSLPNDLLGERLMSDRCTSCGTRADSERVQFLRLQAVSRMTGLAKSTVLRLFAKNAFPPPVRLATRVIAWRRSDLERWSEERPTVAH